MPRRQSSLEDIRQSLNIECTECHYQIPPAELRLVDREKAKCPKCGAEFVPAQKAPKDENQLVQNCVIRSGGHAARFSLL